MNDLEPIEGLLREDELLDPYTPERAQHLLDVLGEVQFNPYHVRRQP